MLEVVGVVVEAPMQRRLTRHILRRIAFRSLLERQRIASILLSRIILMPALSCWRKRVLGRLAQMLVLAVVLRARLELPGSTAVTVQMETPLGQVVAVVVLPV